jgi:hypothetical protein
VGRQWHGGGFLPWFVGVFQGLTHELRKGEPQDKKSDRHPSRISKALIRISRADAAFPHTNNPKTLQCAAVPTVLAHEQKKAFSSCE